jgi:hypothetical protein
MKNTIENNTEEMRNKIHIIDNYYVAADDRQYILLKIVIRKPKDTTKEPYEAEDIVGYYGSIKQAVLSCISYLLNFNELKLIRDFRIYFEYS